MRPRLVIMVKEPLAGQVKTRLARACGTTRATAFLRTNLNHTLRRLALSPRWHTILAVAPQRAMTSRMFPAHVPKISQGGGDLGRRLAHVMRDAPPGPVVIIGADIPAITSRDIAAAFRALANANAVFGPATDGGYWLVGLSAPARHLDIFAGVRWSSPYALADTRANLDGYTVALIATKDDIDEPADLARLGALAERLIV